MATDLELNMDESIEDCAELDAPHRGDWHEPTICCPQCKTEIKLTESLAAPLIESLRSKYERKLSRQREEYATREAAIKKKEATIEQAKLEIDQQIEGRVADKLKSERASIAAREAQQARRLVETDLQKQATEISNLQELLTQREAKLADAQKAQAELIRKQQELDDKVREVDLTIANRVRESLDAERLKGKQQAEDELKLKVLEKEMTITSLKTKIEELQRKAEQGSQQLQGEVQEVELESVLRLKFPHDSIDPVAKGEYGGDVMHCVATPVGVLCGKILWETKRTKNWSDGWLAKLRDDQRTAKAEFAVIVSQALPKGVSTFDLVEGVWVICPQIVLPIAVTLRQFLLELALARQAGEGQQTKMALIYQYLTGPRFRDRIQAIAEKIADMQEDLEKERKTMTKQWSKREQQIHAVIESTAGMYGDLQGIAGKTLQEIEGLDIKLLTDGQTP